MYCWLYDDGVFVVEIGNECEYVEVVFGGFEFMWLFISVGDDVVFLI